jgi:hypothetical protein
MNITVDFVFSWINLLVRIGVVVYVVKKYLINRIVAGIRQEQHELKYLKEQHVALQGICKKIEQQIQEDELAYESMQKKFAIWNEVVKNQADRELLICQTRQEQIKKHAILKSAFTKRRNFMQTQVPVLLQETMQLLQNQFKKDAASGKTYQTKVLKALEE